MLPKRKFDYSKITDNLYVGRAPHGKNYMTLRDMGVTLIVNMRADWPSKLLSRQSMIEEVWLPSIDNRYIPFNKRRPTAVASQASKLIDGNGKVYVYCRMGRHRSIAMTTAILILQGYDIASLSRLISRQRPIADLKAVQVASAISIFGQSHRGEV